MSEFFGSDRFDRAFRSAVKRYGFSVAEKKDSNLYILSRDGVEIEADTSEPRRQSDAESFAAELDSRFGLESRLCSFTNAQAVLRLMAVPENGVKDNFIAAPFAGSLMKAVCYADDGSGVYMLDSRYLKKWGVPKEVLFSVADRNMGQLLSRLGFNFPEIVPGVNAAELRSRGDPLAVSTMMCTDFRELMSEKFGETFLVTAPSRDSLLAVHEIPQNILDSLAEAVQKDYKWADDPLTAEIFCFSPDGITVI